MTVLEYAITVQSTVAGEATARSARAPSAMLALDTDPAGREDAFNPAELLLTAFAACMLKGIERVAPMLRFQWRGAEAGVRGVRQDDPPRMLRIDYVLTVDTGESDARLELLHRNVQKFGTVFNTVSWAVEVTGTIRRRAVAAASRPAV